MPRYIDADKFIKNERELYCKNCDRRFGTKNGKLKEIYQIGDAPCRSCELNDALDSLEDFPTADVEPVRHGKWVYHFRLKKFVCLECGFEQKHKPNFRYCPNCGAKMDEGGAL